MIAPQTGIALFLVLAFLSASSFGILPAQAKLPADKLDQLPPAASRPVDFHRDIQPILEASCVKCHGHGKAKGGFQLDSRETFLRAGDSGPSVTPGNSRDSLLIHLVSGLDPDSVMPVKGSKLTAEQVGLLRAWIDQGLKWEPGVSFARDPHRNLQPRRPELPAALPGREHPIDRWMGAYFERQGVVPRGPVDDLTFARRATLDLVGLLPTPEELERFLGDPGPDRRARLVRSLLADGSRYAQHWLSFWNDLLRNDYKGTGYIDGGREPVSKWLYTALRENKPYDQFVRELVNPGDGPARGFAKGIVWRGVVNSSQTPQMQAAQNIGQVFLGVNLKCASCHDSFIDDWQLSDAYGMAAIYADTKLELVQCDKPLGRFAQPKFLFGGATEIDPAAPRAARIARLAELITRPENGRLTRTLVNRLWSRLLGRGLVEPLDVMQNAAWDPDLLDWLAEDFVSHGHDIKHTLELIATSAAYQMPGVDTPEKASPDFVFRGPSIRRLSAEQFRDALSQVTGVWAQKPEGDLDRLLVEKGPGTSAPLAAAFWIWSDPHAAQSAPPGTVWFRRTFAIQELPGEAVTIVNADNSVRLWLNGQSVRRQNDTPWNESTVVDLRPFLRIGTNVLAAEAVNATDSPSPAGLLAYVRFRARPGDPASMVAGASDFGTDAAWLVSTNRADGWMKPEFDASSWGRAQVLGPADVAPWQLGASFAAAVQGQTVFGRVRSSLVSSDPLSTALGRPNREQVTSLRAQAATTLQLLELTNGGTLAQLLHQGAEKLAQESGPPRALVDRLFLQGLGRKPSTAESELAMGLVGSPVKVEGLEDLVWSMAMLPEFQLMY